MKYSKKFESHSDYETYINSADFIKPNLDVCRTNKLDDNHFHKKEINYLKCVYDVSNISVSTNLMDNTNYQSLNNINKMFIDGEEVTKTASYQFSTIGKHTVLYDIIVNPQTGALQMSFNNVKTLTDVTLPDKCKAFHSNSSTFQDCNSLHNIYNVPAGFNPLPYITGDDFCYTQLDSITIKDSSYVDSRRNCNAIIDSSTHELIIGTNNTIIPGDVSVIKYCAFQGRQGLSEDFIIPKNIKSIGVMAFATTNLTKLHIYKGCKSIGLSAFLDCTNLTTLQIDEGIEVIGQVAFGRTGLTGAIELPGSLTAIPTSIFNESNGITSIKLNEGTTTIQYAALNGISGLNTVDLPSTITTIGSTHVSYGDSQGYAFAWNAQLTSIICRATTPPTLYGNSAYGGIASNFVRTTPKEQAPTYLYNSTPYCSLYVPAESVNAYKNAAGWSLFGSRILPIQ